MRVSAIACGLFACFVSQVAATALTYKLHANEKACFYAKTQKDNEKIAFYFAVQSGGSFDVDYTVTGPGNKMILDGAKERQGDFVFTAQQMGDYEFCFNNEMSTFAEKFVDFEIAVENEVRAQLPAKQGASPEQHSTLEETIFKLSGQLSTISRGQKYFRTRENRNFSTVRSTEGRIINFSMIQCALIVLMGALQVFIVRFFFQGARKGYVLSSDFARTYRNLTRASSQDQRYLWTRNRIRQPNPPRQRAPPKQHTTSAEVDRDSSMPRDSRRSSKNPKKHKEQPKEEWYIIKDILQERRNGSNIEYLVDWEDNPETGERYRPTWAPSKDVTSKAIFDWRRKLDLVYQEDGTAPAGEPVLRDVRGVAQQGSPAHTPSTRSIDSSQPVQTANRRRRPQSRQSEDLQNPDSDNDSNPPQQKRYPSEVPSLLSSASEVDTDAASDVVYNNTTASFFVAIPSKVDRDFSEYISISDSRGSTSLSSQPISALEDEDSQVVITEGLSQRTIPDSQEYSAFDTQDSPFSSRQGASTSNKGDACVEREIPDSQKQSSLRTSLSKSTDSQARYLSPADHRSHFFVRRTPLESPHPASQNHPPEPVSSGYIPLTQNSPEPSQGPSFDLDQASPFNRHSAVEPAASHPPRRASREHDSLPSVSDRSIPSHQIDDLRAVEQAENSAIGDYPQDSQPTRTPIFLTQPAFDFDTSTSQATSSAKSASSKSQQQTENQEWATEQVIACSDTRPSQNTQAAQVVQPLLDISASQSSTEEPVVPDTVRRRPSRIRFSPTVTSSGSPPSQRDEDEVSEADSFQTCFERRSLPPHPSSSTKSQGSDRPLSLPPAMDTSGDEPLSAIEELMRIQEAALQGTLGEAGLTSPTTESAQIRHDDPSLDADLAFSAPMDHPSIQINSQPPLTGNWTMGEPVTSSTDMPGLAGAPVEPAMEPLIHEEHQTASMGDIFPSNLMPPEAAEQLPITISPSDISRSVEPEEASNTLPQPEDHPMDMLPEDQTTAGDQSTVTSPDVEEPYLSGPPTTVDQSEYLVTLSFPANIRPLYRSTIKSYRNMIEQFTKDMQSEEDVPDKTAIESISKMFSQLRDICDMPAPLDGDSIDALSAEDLKKHAMGTNSKFFFVGRFLERLQTSHKKILILARDINVIGYLEAIVGTGDMAYSRKGLHELESQDEHSLLVVLMHSEQALVDDLSDFDVVIGFDNGILQTDLLDQWGKMNGKKPMLLRLTTTCSIEHLELLLPADFTGLVRQNALCIAVCQSRKMSYLDERDNQGVMIDHYAVSFANQAILPDPGFDWDPELIPSSVLDLYSSSQPESQAEEPTRKRKTDGEQQQAVKRLRVSPLPGQDPGDIDAAVRSQLNPRPSQLHVQTTQEHLDTLTDKVSELEHQLEEKNSMESNLRKQVINLSKRVKSYDETTNSIQAAHMASLRERARFEAERDEAKRKEEQALEKSREWQEKAQAFEEKLKAKSATLEEALVNAGSVATETFKEKTAELEKALAKVAELEKKLESRDGELSYARDAYQTANHSNSELSRENRELKEQVAAMQSSVPGNLAQVLNVTANAGQQVKEMQRQIAETKAITKDREKELARVEKELRALKNGRRETRQQSVPRSPRLSVMSPRTGRAAGGGGNGGSASRGTSPTPHESGGGTPVAGLQFFNNSANNRWPHLRD
ncbi:hypothetical protein CLIM01_09801 [Colletotrichum limetticola]|uniref:Endosomal cargo receptor n=1 Tax=Colletotrichum limetticola TaxID=1209924 RepID=A0ABQ9PMT7_9PEZI|nr:hypothetical protein CLIM01_09801 [Colletotrichum limetticola]